MCTYAQTHSAFSSDTHSRLQWQWPACPFCLANVDKSQINKDKERKSAPPVKPTQAHTHTPLWARAEPEKLYLQPLSILLRGQHQANLFCTFPAAVSRQTMPPSIGSVPNREDEPVQGQGVHKSFKCECQMIFCWHDLQHPRFHTAHISYTCRKQLQQLNSSG